MKDYGFKFNMSNILVCRVFSMFLFGNTVLPSGIKNECAAVMHDLLLYRCDFLQTAVPQDGGIKQNHKRVEHMMDGATSTMQLFN